MVTRSAVKRRIFPGNHQRRETFQKGRRDLSLNSRSRMPKLCSAVGNESPREREVISSRIMPFITVKMRMATCLIAHSATKLARNEKETKAQEAEEGLTPS